MITEVANYGFVQERRTAEGGTARKFVNKTGAASVAGELVKMGGGVTKGVVLTGADDFSSMGVMYESGVADGSEVWVVTDGFAEVLLEDTTAATVGYWARASTTAPGRADCTISAPPGLILSHFAEIGHVAQDQTTGTDKKALVLLHFN